MKWVLCAVFLSAAVVGASDRAALGERVVLDLPESAQYRMRGAGIMSTFPGDDETLFWVGEGADRIAVHAEELDMLADDDFERQAKTLIESYTENGAEWEVKTLNPHIIYGLRKNAPEKAAEAELYGVALIRHKDGSVIRLAIFFAPNHAKTPEKNCEWAENVIRKVRFGPGVRSSAARVETIRFFTELTLDVPVSEGYVRSTKPGHDFSYTTFTKLGKQGEPREYFGIYLGGHPSFKKENFKDAQRVKSTIAGKGATWYCTEPKPGIYAAETCLLLTGGGFFSSEPPVYSHLLIRTSSPEERTELIDKLTHVKLITPAP